MYEFNIVSKDDNNILHKPKSKAFHRRTQSNSSYDLNNIFINNDNHNSTTNANIILKKEILISNNTNPVNTNIEDIIINHNIIGSSVTLKALESCKNNSNNGSSSNNKEIIIDDINHIPKLDGLIVPKKHNNSINYIKKRNLTTCLLNTTNAYKEKVIDHTQNVHDIIGLNTIYEKRNSIDSFDPENIDTNSTGHLSKNVSNNTSKEYQIEEELNIPKFIDNDNTKNIIKNDLYDARKVSGTIFDKKNKNRFIDELKKKLTSTKNAISTNISPRNSNTKQFFTLKSITPNGGSANSSQYSTYRMNSNKNLFIKPPRSNSRTRLSISPHPTSTKSQKTKHTEQKDYTQMTSFSKYFLSINSASSENRTPVNTETTQNHKQNREAQGNSINSKKMINEKRVHNNSVSQITIQDYENKIDSLKYQVNALTSKSNNLEDQVNQLMLIIEQLTETNRELQQKQQEQELKIRKLENRCIDEENYSQKTRCTFKLGNDSDKKAMSLRQDFSSNNILNTTDMSTLESPNDERSNIGGGGKLINNKEHISPLPFQPLDQSLNHNKSLTGRLGNDSSNKLVDKFNLYKTQIKKIHFEDYKKASKKFK